MILSSLVRLAERQGLTAERGFDERPVHWIVDIDQSGTVLGVTSTAQKEDGAKKETFKLLSIPKRISRASAVIAGLVLDNAQYLFGIGDPKKEFKKDRVQKTVDAFMEGLAPLCDIEIAIQAQAQALIIIHNDLPGFAKIWLNSEKYQEAPSLSGMLHVPKTWASNHLFVFRCNQQFVTGIPSVRAWVSSQAVGTGVDHSDITGDLCLVSGRWSVPKRLIDPIDLKGDTGPVPLISFNCSAFWHYGRENNENAPVSVDAADAVFSALQFLLKPGSTRHLRLNGKTTVLFWSDISPAVATTDAVDDLLGLCLNADPAAVRRVEALYGAPHDGRPVPVVDLTPFCSLILTREKKRVSVRSAVLTTAHDVGISICRWFADLAIDGAGDRPYRAIWMLTKSTASAKAKDPEAIHDLSARLYQAAISGGKLPPEALATVLRRIRSEGHDGVTPSRIALIKATLIRSFSQEIPVSLNPDHPAPAYHLGRLFAVLEAIQDTAINANAGIADRFLGAAMGTPALVFPRLLKLHHHHLSKIGGGLAVNYAKQIDAIVSRLPPDLPRTQALVEQGTFMVGYHHQRADRFKKSSDTPAKDQP